jgi:hypothetical protein
VENIALPLSQLNSGTLASGVLVPAANIQSGAIGASVLVSSLPLSGVTAATYGSGTNYPWFTTNAQGIVTAAGTYTLSGSTSTAFNNIDNGWLTPQTFFSSVTINGNVAVSSITGNGSGLFGIIPNAIAAGTFPSNVVASSVTIPYLTIVGSSVTASAFFGDGSHLSGITASFAGGAVANVTTFASSVTVNGAGILSKSSVTASAFFGDASHLSGVVSLGVYNVFTASQAMPGLALTYGVNAATGVFSGAVTASSMSATYLSGNLTGNVSGSAGSVAAANVTSGVLGAAVVASSVAVGAITNQQVAAGIFPSITVYSSGVASGALGTGVTISTANIVPGFNGANQLVQLTSGGALPAVSGANLTNVASGKSGFLTGTNQTLGVGTFLFGYVNQAVVISSMSVLITTAGTGGSSGTIWACCYGGSCVSVTSSQGAAIGSTFTGNGSVSVPAGGQIVLQITSTGESYTPTANGICGYQ